MTHLWVSSFIILLTVVGGQLYTSNLDRNWSDFLRRFKTVLVNITSKQNWMNTIYHSNKNFRKVQIRLSASQPFFCDAKTGPGARSKSPPSSVNQVRPGDIDVIAAIGDSLTAANGAMSTDLFDLMNENRGIAWSIGGRAEWRKYLTLPNILREFNTDLYGYSTNNSLTINRASKFNVADAMTQYDDMLFQAKVLLKRMRRDPLVKIKTDWKLVTIFLGSNDICSKLCGMPKSLDIIQEHKKSVYATLRYLRKHLPRTLVNWVLLPNLIKLSTIQKVPIQCYLAQRIECPCIYSAVASPEKLRVYDFIIKQMQKAQINIVNKDEFHSNTFTVNLQPFTYNITIPILSNKKTDLRYFASDCFHFSQLGQAAAANALWNNMIQPIGKKQVDWMPIFKRFDCPTNKNSFIATRANRKWA